MAKNTSVLTGKISNSGVQKVESTFKGGSEKKPSVKKGGDLRSK